MKLHLSLTNINCKSPYQVSLTDGNSFYFTTEEGNEYEIGFIKDDMFGLSDAYQFFIVPKGEANTIKDEKIQLTIVAVIEEFFRTKEVLLDYICDTNDGRQATRSRLFSHWFCQFPNRKLYTLRTLTLYYENIAFYASVIIRNDNPKYEECLSAIDNFESEIRGKLDETI